MALIGGLKRWYLSLRETVAAGHYEGAPHRSDEILDSCESCESPEEKAGRFSFNLSLMIASDVALGAFAAATSLPALGFAAAGLAVLGGLFYLDRFLTLRVAAEDRIAETNLAGQSVEGSRRDLYRLHRAQARVLDLSLEFANAKAAGLKEAVEEKIDRVIAGVQDALSHTKVADAGTHHAGSIAYAFVRPSIHIHHMHRHCQSGPRH